MLSNISIAFQSTSVHFHPLRSNLINFGPIRRMRNLKKIFSCTKKENIKHNNNS